MKYLITPHILQTMQVNDFIGLPSLIEQTAYDTATTKTAVKNELKELLNNEVLKLEAAYTNGGRSLYYMVTRGKNWRAQ